MNFQHRSGTPAYALIAAAPPGEKQRGRANEPDFVAVLMTLVRLVDKKTDIVVAVNVPHVGGRYDAAGVISAQTAWEASRMEL